VRETCVNVNCDNRTPFDRRFSYLQDNQIFTIYDGMHYLNFIDEAHHGYAHCRKMTIGPNYNFKTSLSVRIRNYNAVATNIWLWIVYSTY